MTSYFICLDLKIIVLFIETKQKTEEKSEVNLHPATDGYLM